MSALRPVYVVSKKEFWTNLFSVRMAILAAVFALAVVGAAYGFSGAAVAPPSELQLAVFPHPILTEDEAGAAVFVADAWGVPHVGIPVELYREDPGVEPPTERTPLAVVNTDADGFARFTGLEEDIPYGVEVSLGNVRRGFGVYLNRTFVDGNLTLEYEQYDLDNAGVADDLVIHLLDLSGVVPMGAEVYLEETLVGSPDARGYLRLELREGINNVTVRYVDETYRSTWSPREAFGSTNPFAQGPDAVLAFIAFFFASALLPIVAIALSFDSIAKERVEGSAELLLYRPASWRSLGLGKFLGIFVALALPVTAVNVGGVAVVTLVTGTLPTPSFVTAFLAFALFLLAVYILLMQVLSTLAKTVGTAILFGFLLWFAFNFLWGIVIFLVALVVGLGPGSREYFVLSSYLGLANPNSVYQSLVALALPGEVGFFGGPVGGLFALPEWAGPVAAVVWLGALLVLFLEVYQRRAAA